MKLDSILKIKKVKFVGASDSQLTNGKHYTILGATDKSCIIVDDNECEIWAGINDFEPVLDSAENQLQNIELTPEFEAVVPHVSYSSNNDTYVGEPKFKHGDKVYAPSIGAKIYTLKDVGDGLCYPMRIDCSYDEDHEFTKDGLITAEGLSVLFLATELNHALLSQLYPYIEFEQPPKELKGSDLAMALIKKGWVGFNCLCGNSGDKNAITETIVTGINNSGQFTTVGGRLFNNAVPMLGSFPLKAEQVGL